MPKNAFFSRLLTESSAKYPKKNRIVFISENGIRGNVKYSFLYLNKLAKEQFKDWELIWFGKNDECEILRKLGYKAYPSDLNWQTTADALMESKLAIYGQHYFQDTNDWFWQSTLAGSKKIQLWHGPPAKQVGAKLSARCDSHYAYAGLMHDVTLYDYVVSENDHLCNTYQESFPASDILSFGSCRNDYLLSSDITLENHLIGTNTDSIKKLSNDNQIKLLIAPTFKEPRSPNIVFEKWLEIIKFLLTHGEYQVVVKLHPKHIALYPKDEDLLFNSFQNDENYIYVGRFEDIQPYMKICDALITDYSSSAIDFSVTGKPVYFYQPDSKIYWNERDQSDLMKNFQKTKGHTSSNSKELINLIKNISANTILNNKFNNAPEAHIKLFNFIDKLMGNE